MEGPHNDRTITRVAYAEFASEDWKKKALDVLKEKSWKIDGNDITIKPARTDLNGKRNFSIRKASELITEAAASDGKEVKIVWSKRKVNVNTHDAFVQSKTEVGGSFLPPYDGLHLP